MHDHPLISVIVPCYNQETMIQNTIHSVLDQTYPHWECLVIDDGSEDNSSAVINELLHSDQRISYFFQTNQGVASARNLGFSKAKGEFIQFLDGDDRLHPTKFQLQIEHFLNDPSIDVSYTNHQFHLLDEDKYCSYEFLKIDDYPLEQFLFKWFDGVSLPVHAPMYKRTIWQDRELPYPPDYKERCEDWVFLVMVALKEVKFAFYDEILCTYCISQSNFTDAPEDWNVAAILAAQYLESRIPEGYRTGFVKGVIQRTLKRYLRSKRAEVLQSSGNWQLGNMITKPVFTLLKAIRRPFLNSSQRRGPN